jgi:outer membrane protein
MVLVWTGLPIPESLKMQADLPSCSDLSQNNLDGPFLVGGLIIKKQVMKKLSLLILLAAVFGFTATAQRYAVIDTRYILSKLPEYTEAQKKLDAFSIQWQQEIDLKQAALDQLYRNFESEKVMLSEDLLKKREDDLFNKEKELRDLQKKRFGFEGDLFKRRQELVKPIQDKVYSAVQKLASARQYDLILDKSEGITIIFADPKLDKSDDILKELTGK